MLRRGDGVGRPSRASALFGFPATQACSRVFQFFLNSRCDGVRAAENALYQNADASQDDVTAAIAQLEDLDRRMTRTYGTAHPQPGHTRRRLAEAREKLAHLE